MPGKYYAQTYQDALLRVPDGEISKWCAPEVGSRSIFLQGCGVRTRGVTVLFVVAIHDYLGLHHTTAQSSYQWKRGMLTNIHKEEAG